MKDPRSLHLKLQEYTDCYAETDPLDELRQISMKGIGGEPTEGMTDLALKYLSLATLYGVGEEAKKVVFTCEGDYKGSCQLQGKKSTLLPRLPSGLAQKIVGVVRCISDLEQDDDDGMLICGIRNDQMEIHVGVSRDGQGEAMVMHLAGHAIH